MRKNILALADNEWSLILYLMYWCKQYWHSLDRRQCKQNKEFQEILC